MMRQDTTIPLLTTRESKTHNTCAAGLLRCGTLVFLSLLIISASLGFYRFAKQQHMLDTEIAVGMIRPPRPRTETLKPGMTAGSSSSSSSSAQREHPSLVNEVWEVARTDDWYDGLFAITGNNNGKAVTYWGWNRETGPEDFKQLYRLINEKTDAFMRPGQKAILGGIAVAVGFHGDPGGRDGIVAPGAFYADARDEQEYEKFLAIRGRTPEETIQFFNEDYEAAAMGGPPYNVGQRNVLFITPPFGGIRTAGVQDRLDPPFTSPNGERQFHQRWASIINAVRGVEHVIFSFCHGSVMTRRKQMMLQSTHVTSTEWEPMKDMATILEKIREVVESVSE